MDGNTDAFYYKNICCLIKDFHLSIFSQCLLPKNSSKFTHVPSSPGLHCQPQLSNRNWVEELSTIFRNTHQALLLVAITSSYALHQEFLTNRKHTSNCADLSEAQRCQKIQASQRWGTRTNCLGGWHGFWLPRSSSTAEKEWAFYVMAQNRQTLDYEHPGNCLLSSLVLCDPAPLPRPPSLCNLSP